MLPSGNFRAKRAAATDPIKFTLEKLERHAKLCTKLNKGLGRRRSPRGKERREGIRILAYVKVFSITTRDTLHEGRWP